MFYNPYYPYRNYTAVAPLYNPFAVYRLPVPIYVPGPFGPVFVGYRY